MSLLVWDASALHHPARAERLDVLGDVAKRHDNVTTAAVEQELDRYGLAGRIHDCTWLRIEHVDGLHELEALVRWTVLMSDGLHNRGEATVCAWAETHGGTAILDDEDAKVAASTAGLVTHGSLWVIAEGVRTGDLGEIAADGLVDAFAREGARFPFELRGFSRWARVKQLL